MFGEVVKSREVGEIGEGGGVEGDEVDVGGAVVGWAVAGSVEGRETGRVFGEFVCPEVPVGSFVGDPESGVSVSWVGGLQEGRGNKV